MSSIRHSDHRMKHLEVHPKKSAARRIFNSLLGVSSGDETLRSKSVKRQTNTVKSIKRKETGLHLEFYLLYLRSSQSLKILTRQSERPPISIYPYL